MLLLLSMVMLVIVDTSGVLLLPAFLHVLSVVLGHHHVSARGGRHRLMLLLLLSCPATAMLILTKTAEHRAPTRIRRRWFQLALVFVLVFVLEAQLGIQQSGICKLLRCVVLFEVGAGICHTADTMMTIHIITIDIVIIMISSVGLVIRIPLPAVVAIVVAIVVAVPLVPRTIRRAPHDHAIHRGTHRLVTSHNTSGAPGGATHSSAPEDVPKTTAGTAQDLAAEGDRLLGHGESDTELHQNRPEVIQELGDVAKQKEAVVHVGHVCRPDPQPEVVGVLSHLQHEEAEVADPDVGHLGDVVLQGVLQGH